MSKLTTVRITKILHRNDAAAPERPADYPAGHPHRHASLPTGYTLEGYLVNPHDLRPGQCLFLVRYRRNGVDALGWTLTSPIQSVEPQPDGTVRYTTENSVYLMEYLPYREPNEIETEILQDLLKQHEEASAKS